MECNSVTKRSELLIHGLAWMNLKTCKKKKKESGQENVHEVRFSFCKFPEHTKLFSVIEIRTVITSRARSGRN